MTGERCAACGNPAMRDRGNEFMIDRPAYGPDVAYVKLCKACWTDGENDEAWNERITQRVIDRAANAEPSDQRAKG